ncbi:hypothetical protein NLI92_005269 [Priestia megaterium]|uniref:hypothetical protein n=1 Tax=Priestia megaterium TaxID=1404 RepID=UPI0021ABFA97|nr:hypothetical protein [Priestia megaterium]MCR8929758.1 hypothetical protein [Priestia megaterium]
MKKIIIIILSLVIAIGNVSVYINYKKYSSKVAVENYLMHEKNINKKNINKKTIEKLEPFIANLQGDKKWLVYVKLRGDDKKYYYYKDNKDNKVVLESYILKGKEYGE